MYVLRKQLRKYRGPAIIAATFVFVVTVGFIASLTFWHQAERARQAEAAQRRLAENQRDSTNAAMDRAERSYRELLRVLSHVSDRHTRVYEALKDRLEGATLVGSFIGTFENVRALRPEDPLIPRVLDSLRKQLTELMVAQTDGIRSAVRFSGQDRSIFESALEHVEYLRYWKDECREYDDAYFVTTLGIAQYRVGRHEDALETLARSDEISSLRCGNSHPADVAFIAMSLHQLGRHEDAQAARERLRELMQNEKWANDEESQAFLREAETLISSVSPPPAQTAGETEP